MSSGSVKVHKIIASQWNYGRNTDLYIIVGGVITSAMASQTTAYRLIAQPFVQAQIKENIKLRLTGLCEWNPPVTGGFPHKGPVTQKMFDDVIMQPSLVYHC